MYNFFLLYAVFFNSCDEEDEHEEQNIVYHLVEMSIGILGSEKRLDEMEWQWNSHFHSNFTFKKLRYFGNEVVEASRIYVKISVEEDEIWLYYYSKLFRRFKWTT